MPEKLRSEHRRLLQQMDDLRREHERQQIDRHDRDGHVQHRDKLLTQLAELRAHMNRLRSTA